jgi:transposase
MSQPTTKKYPAACKERAVKLAVESEQSLAQTARDLGVHAHTWHPWLGTYHRVARQAPQGNDAQRYEACKRLRQEHARVQEERDLVKKAAASWAPQRPYSTPGDTSRPRSAASVAWVGSWRSRAGAMRSGWGVRFAHRGKRRSPWRPKESPRLRRGVARTARAG